MLQTSSHTAATDTMATFETPESNAARQSDENRAVLYKLVLPLLNVILAVVVLSLTLGASAVVTLCLALSPLVGYFIYKLLFDEQF